MSVTECSEKISRECVLFKGVPARLLLLLAGEFLLCKIQCLKLSIKEEKALAGKNSLSSFFFIYSTNLYCELMCEVISVRGIQT